jgi:hypothetical protein
MHSEALHVIAGVVALLVLCKIFILSSTRRRFQNALDDNSGHERAERREEKWYKNQPSRSRFGERGSRPPTGSDLDRVGQA